MEKPVPGGAMVACNDCGAEVDNDTVALLRHLGEHSRGDQKHRESVMADVRRLAELDREKPRG